MQAPCAWGWRRKMIRVSRSRRFEQVLAAGYGGLSPPSRALSGPPLPFYQRGLAGPASWGLKHDTAHAQGECLTITCSPVVSKCFERVFTSDHEAVGFRSRGLCHRLELESLSLPCSRSQFHFGLPGLAGTFTPSLNHFSREARHLLNHLEVGFILGLTKQSDLISTSR